MERRSNPLLPLLALVVTAALVLGIAYGVLRFVGMVGGGADDYSGDGSGSVTVVVPSGASGQEIAQILDDADVVKSAEAFYAESLGDERSAGIQPGAYKLHRQMSAESALDALLDGKNRLEARVVIPEGFRVGQIVDAIVAGSDLTKNDVTAVLDDPDQLGLPEEADGNPEGYFYPATYVVDPGMSAVELLKQMVQKTLDVIAELDIAQRAADVNLDTEQVMTVASILEFEARREVDYPKVARVLYNRLNEDIPLQLDSTVSYVSKRKGDVWTTAEERADPSDYNTYQHIGLPPGPIGSPGRATIEAALHPADGDWLYFLADKKGVTHFSNTYEDHVKKCHAIYGSQTQC
ncbi:MAG TPA: endolytic transglycosylase MltG [Aeromicrobium sp.]|nr:endolytic transglycosylase MltG [Aeromicrobium sp.]